MNYDSVNYEYNYIMSLIMNEWEIKWSYQARVKFYIVECLTNLLCSMYSDGLLSARRKEGTWIEREHQYAKTLRESRTMAGDTKLVCNVIKFWYVLMHWHAWTLNKSGNLDNWGRRIIMLWFVTSFSHTWVTWKKSSSHSVCPWGQVSSQGCHIVLDSSI